MLPRDQLDLSLRVLYHRCEDCNQKFVIMDLMIILDNVARKNISQKRIPYCTVVCNTKTQQGILFTLIYDLSCKRYHLNDDETLCLPSGSYNWKKILKNINYHVSINRIKLLFLNANIIFENFIQLHC